MFCVNSAIDDRPAACHWAPATPDPKPSTAKLTAAAAVSRYLRTALPAACRLFAVICTKLLVLRGDNGRVSTPYPLPVLLLSAVRRTQFALHRLQQVARVVDLSRLHHQSNFPGIVMVGERMPA